MEKHISNSVADTIKIAEEFAKGLKVGDCVLYTGEMGAGKTHFTKGIAKHFGVDGEVTSPTFALVNEYIGTPVSVFHFDLFRINSYDDLYAIGFFDYLDMGAVIASEWSENIENALPEEKLIKIEILRGENDDSRILCLSGDEIYENSWR